MNETLKSRLLQFRWHLAGLLWVVLTAALGYGGTMLSGSDQTSVVLEVSAPVPTQLPKKQELSPKALSAVAPLGDGIRIWEAAPIMPTSGLAKAKPLTPELWKISGVFESNEGRRLIVEYPNLRTSEYLKVGDALPNGARIVAVDQKNVTVKTKVANQLKIIVLDF